MQHYFTLFSFLSFVDSYVITWSLCIFRIRNVQNYAISTSSSSDANNRLIYARACRVKYATYAIWFLSINSIWRVINDWRVKSTRLSYRVVLTNSKHFGERYRLHLQGLNVGQQKKSRSRRRLEAPFPPMYFIFSFALHFFQQSSFPYFQKCNKQATFTLHRKILEK